MIDPSLLESPFYKQLQAIPLVGEAFNSLSFVCFIYLGLLTQTCHSDFFCRFC